MSTVYGDMRDHLHSAASPIPAPGQSMLSFMLSFCPKPLYGNEPKTIIRSFIPIQERQAAIREYLKNLGREVCISEMSINTRIRHKIIKEAVATMDDVKKTRQKRNGRITDVYSLIPWKSSRRGRA